MTTQTEALRLALEALKLGDTVFYPQTSIAIAAIEGVLAQQSNEQVEPFTLETVYETIIQWDDGGGKRSRRELARRIVSLFAHAPVPTAQPKEPAPEWMTEEEQTAYTFGWFKALESQRIAQPEQEPVAYITPLMEQQLFDDWCPYKGNPDPRVVWAAAIDAVNGLLIGATPPQRKPLTREQISGLRQQHGITSDGRGIKEWTQVVDFARAIEAAHGIKE